MTKVGNTHQVARMRQQLQAQTELRSAVKAERRVAAKRRYVPEYRRLSGAALPSPIDNRRLLNGRLSCPQPTPHRAKPV